MVALAAVLRFSEKERGNDVLISRPSIDSSLRQSADRSDSGRQRRERNAPALRSRVLAGALLAAVTATPSIAHADSLGTTGTVAEVMVNEPSADDYGVQIGYLIVNEGGVKRKYQWGGTACSGRNVSSQNIALLVGAMRSGVTITPSYKPGTSQARCLVGFRLVA